MQKILLSVRPLTGPVSLVAVTVALGLGLISVWALPAAGQEPIPLEASEFADLDRAMCLSVEAVSPSVVRVLVPEYSKEQQKILAERKRRERVDQMQADELKREAEQRMTEAARDNPRLQELQKQLKEMTEKLAELEGAEFSRQLEALQKLLQEIEAAKPALEERAAGEGEAAPAEAEEKAEPAEPAESQEAEPQAEKPEAAEQEKAAAPAAEGEKPLADKPAEPADDGKPLVPVKQHPRSGVIVSADGYIITSLVGCGRQREGLQVELSDGRKLDAKALGEDLRRDVLLLKVEAEGLPAVKVVRRDDLKLGQWVLALGRTLPIGGTTVNKGIISSLRRHAGLALQTDANISPVNFGGLLADIRGQGVAMIASVDVAGSSAAASRYSDSGIGFAVPLEDILAQMETLKAGKRIEPPFLGVQFNMTRLESGAEIQEVIANTAAGAAGMKAGDIIFELDGKAIESCYQLLHEIGSRSVGDSVTMKVHRGEEEVELTAKLRARPTRFRG